MRKVNSFRRLVGAGVIAGSIAASLVTTAPSGAAVSAHGDQVPKTALISPMGPTDHANMIFPYASGAYFTVTNMNDFQSYLYRPLYWVGKGSDITIQKDLSLAALPVYSNGNKTITITMKGWKFSNGETIDAQSVKFFLDLYAAVPFRYAGYVPGFGIPDQVSNVTASGNVLTITTFVAVNPNWFNYNFLTEITPFPRAWDKKYDTPSSDTIANTPSIATSAANCGTADYTNIVDLAAKCGYYPNSTADAYGVPCLWVKLSDILWGGSFKFHDYFESVGRGAPAPVIPDDDMSLAQVTRHHRPYEVKIDLRPLINACPFMAPEIRHKLLSDAKEVVIN